MLAVLPITECHVTLNPRPGREVPRLLAGADLCLADAVAIHGIKLVEATDGTLIVSMPSSHAKRPESCGCGGRPLVRDRHCPFCGVALERIDTGRRIYHDVVHPIRHEMRLAIEAAVLDAYDAALARVRGGAA
jgi:DNA-binding cell septation regulator SpoVG